MYLEGTATSSIFLHIAIIDLTGKVRDSKIITHLNFPFMWNFTLLLLYKKQLKPGNAVQAARKHIQKAAQKHLKGHQKQPSRDFSVLSSEDGRGFGFRRDLDTMSQDSRNGEMFWPVAKAAAAYKGAMSEPVRRAHRVKIHEPPETRRGIFRRMSSTDSHHTSSSLCMKDDSFDFGSPPQTSCINGPTPGSQNPIQEEFENEQNESALLTCAEQETDETHEPERPELCQPEQCQEEPQMRDGATQPEVETNPLPQPRHLPHPQIQPEANPPSSPARVRRTIGTSLHPLPSTPVRTKVRSHSCPRKQTTIAQTPMALRKNAPHLRAQGSLHRGSSGNQMRSIPNGLCLSDSTSSSSDVSDVSTDSQEFAPSVGPDGAEQREGTLQREMKALFDQRLREIRCKSPLFFLNGGSCDSHLQEQQK